MIEEHKEKELPDPDIMERILDKGIIIEILSDQEKSVDLTSAEKFVVTVSKGSIN